MNPDMWMEYLDFVEERHKIYAFRQMGAPTPWTDNPILKERKFTNVFRILDPGSQYVLRSLFSERLSERDTLMRAFLYRHTGVIPMWEFFFEIMGRYPLTVDLSSGDLLHIWKAYRDKGNPVFTNAYLVFPQSQVKGTDKLESIVDLTRRLFDSRDSVVESFLASKRQDQKFKVLQSVKGVGDFMSMQVLTDWGYSQFGEDKENEFVVLGPGAKKGVAALRAKDGMLTLLQAHRAVTETQIHITLPHNDFRTPSLMDIQNTLCEFSKYARFLGKPKTGKPYQPAHPGEQPLPLFPPHWWK